MKWNYLLFIVAVSRVLSSCSHQSNVVSKKITAEVQLTLVAKPQDLLSLKNKLTQRLKSQGIEGCQLTVSQSDKKIKVEIPECEDDHAIWLLLSNKGGLEFWEALSYSKALPQFRELFRVTDSIYLHRPKSEYRPVKGDFTDSQLFEDKGDTSEEDGLISDGIIEDAAVSNTKYLGYEWLKINQVFNVRSFVCQKKDTVFVSQAARLMNSRSNYQYSFNWIDNNNNPSGNEIEMAVGIKTGANRLILNDDYDSIEVRREPRIVFDIDPQLYLYLSNKRAKRLTEIRDQNSFYLGIDKLMIITLFHQDPRDIRKAYFGGLNSIQQKNAVKNVIEYPIAVDYFISSFKAE